MHDQVYVEGDERERLINLFRYVARSFPFLINVAHALFESVPDSTTPVLAKPDNLKPATGEAIPSALNMSLTHFSKYGHRYRL